jgi:hypothetical protein
MATTTLSNPLYWRIAASHPLMNSDGQQIRPRIMVDPFLAILEEWGTGTLTATQANGLVTDLSGVGLDSVELQQAQDLFGTISGLGNAQQAMRFHKIAGILHLLEVRVRRAGRLLPG